MIDRQLQLGTHPVITGNQQRVLVTGSLGIEKTAKPADFAVCASTHGRFDQRPDRLDQAVSGIDRDTGIFIGIAFGRFVAGHNMQCFSLSSLEFHSPLGKRHQLFPDD